MNSDSNSSDFRSTTTSAQWDRTVGERILLALTQVARATLFALMVIATWRLSIDGIGLQYKLCVAISIMSAFCLVLHWRGVVAKASGNSVALMAIGVCWVAFALLQSVSLPPSVVSALAPGTQSIRAEFADDGLHTLDPSVFDQSHEQELAAHTTTLSIVPGLTRRRAARDAVALGFLFCALTLFNSPASRRAFAWVLLINASGLACWGIIQQAIESRDLFPGHPNPIASAYFSTFIYKNAAAAAILSGLAMAVGFIYWIHSGYSSKLFGADDEQGQSAGRNTFHTSSHVYAKPNYWFEPLHIVVCCLLIVIVVAVAVSQSRGGCAAALLAGLVALLFARRSIRLVHGLAGAALLVAAVASFVWFTDVAENAIRSAERVSIERVAADVRWTHWRDAISTSTVYAPFGSGLGTYGYAHLAEQSHDSRTWFREAHNQYLETVAEAGLVGILLLIAFCWVIIKTCWALVLNHDNREAKGWGLIGFVLFVALSFQSAFDFVVIIPANMFVFAAILGVVVASHRDLADAATERIDIDRQASSKRLRRVGIATAAGSSCAAALLLMLVPAVASHRGHLSSTRCLANTLISSTEFCPSQQTTEASLAALASAIDREPLNSELHRRRSLWEDMRFRIAVIEAANSKGIALQWEQTSPETLFALCCSLNGQSRRSLREELTADPLAKQALSNRITAMSHSLTLNPLMPQIQMAAAFVSPLCESDPGMWAANSRRLSRSSPELLYANGMISMWMNDKSTMVDLWHRSLAKTRQYDDQIIENSRKLLSPKEVISELFPPQRSDLMMKYVRAVHRSGKTPHSSMLLQDAIAVTRQNETLNDGVRNAMLAQMYMLSEEMPESRSYWKEAVASDPRNLNYRYEYTKTLLLNKDYDAAIRQAVLGQTLEPQSGRFKAIGQRIETQARRHQTRRQLDLSIRRN